MQQCRGRGRSKHCRHDQIRRPWIHRRRHATWALYDDAPAAATGGVAIGEGGSGERGEGAPMRAVPPHGDERVWGRDVPVNKIKEEVLILISCI
jgi:hypothetical protein